MEVVGSARDGAEAFRLYAELRPDITLMDLELPNVSGLEATRRICGQFPDAHIIILTVHQGNEDIFNTLQAGAVAYLFKDALSLELTETIRRVHGGTYSLPAGIAARLREREREPLLTARELEVLKLMAGGKANKEIGSALNISSETVHAHVKHIFSKLKVTDRMAAVNVATSRGLIRRT
jgi:DNA-binding NarL/FixJ family response regulator